VLFLGFALLVAPARDPVLPPVRRPARVRGVFSIGGVASERAATARAATARAATVPAEAAELHEDTGAAS
jgi:hypothetical protein